MHRDPRASGQMLHVSGEQGGVIARPVLEPARGPPEQIGHRRERIRTVDAPPAAGDDRVDHIRTMTAPHHRGPDLVVGELPRLEAAPEHVTEDRELVERGQ